MTPAELIETENRVKDLWEEGELPYLTHLCGGNEEFLCRYYNESVRDEDWVFCSHRTHYHALLYGFTPDHLIAKIKEGKSMFIYNAQFVCSAIVGGVLSIACGKALSAQLRGTGEHVHCFCGDGATDQGAFWEAIRFAEGRDLPITFIVEDNGAQCGVSWETRYPKTKSGDCNVDPLEWQLVEFSKVRYYQYEPTYPHAGTLGPDGKPTRPTIKWK